MINVIIMRKRRVMPYDKCDNNGEEEGDALMIDVIVMRKRRVMPCQINVIIMRKRRVMPL